ncbi:hypothetical protein QAD02_022892 [Eretmocerus hayati]|uniref:Uncharacterized protein n=1 Tax=Eretmocerus hayati TaxID=131215 RepID=A0ACC2PUD1_9HYME|nr:hypothetical protein QAD02_022892 [Eretmocerus hayati]
MDILEQELDEQDPISNIVAKQEHNSGIVIEDTEIVDCDGDNLADEDLQYPEALSYRVVQVNGTPNNDDIDLPVTQAPLQVLTSPINGQFYVIGSANDVFTTAQTSRSVIAPRATATLQIDTPRATTGLKKRDDRRRATHNEVERRRRDKINNWIAKLGKIIPECNSTTNGNGSSGEGNGKANYETQSKGGILAKACEYITELRTANQAMGQCIRDNEKLRQEVYNLKQVVAQLRKENLQLKSQLPSPETTDTSMLA